jgi:pyruvate/2-oxoglutarate dehydrogenase complex dihydrolipoamide acyltransferase (E2) component
MECNFGIMTINMAFSAEPSKIAFHYMEIVFLTQLKIKEILNMTILLDHDVIDRAPMARFISELSKNIKNTAGL